MKLIASKYPLVFACTSYLVLVIDNFYKIFVVKMLKHLKSYGALSLVQVSNEMKSVRRLSPVVLNLGNEKGKILYTKKLRS